MKTYNSNNIRNIVVAGHSGRGKTTLCEAMLYRSGAIERLGRVTEGNTIMDFDTDEKKRGVTVGVSVAPLEWKDVKINLIDTPGLFDFAGALSEGMRAAGCAVIVTDAEKAKYDIGAEKAFKAAEDRGISKFFVVTKTDAENANFGNLFDELKAVHGSKLCPVVVPYIENSRIKYFVNFAQNKAYEYKDGKSFEVEMPQSEKLDAMREMFNESVAESSEELMEKFFAGEKFTEVEAITGLLRGVVDGTIYPIYACSGYTLDAVDLLLDGIVNLGPSAGEKSGEISTDAEGNEVVLKCDENGPLAAICFKTIADPFVGKMSFFKVASGKIMPETPAYNTRTGETERMGKLVIPRGGKQEDTNCISAGDIGVITKLSGFKTGDTLSSEKKSLTLKPVIVPEPCLSMALKVRKKGEEEKVAAGLFRLMEEDPSMKYTTNHETREQILSGLGEQHLDVIISKLKSKFGVEVDLSVPKVAYRETIKKKVEVQGRHKKQSGGHGQFGDVFIRFEPCDSKELVFAEEVFGGSVPKNFFPAVEKGLRDSVEKGVLAGFPMVGIKATLYDGSYHPVDSSEMAFKTAAAVAFRNGIPQATPIILEPIGTLKVSLPDENMGDIMGDVTKRRGRVLGMAQHEEEPGMQEIAAEVPMAEMGDFAITLRSVTRGRGYFSIDFARYEEVPANIAQKIIDESKKDAE
ncbi:MAG: elongation factor G [Clostridia bacterium]|nr:elongation factor G [Clostridia bacterium]